MNRVARRLFSIISKIARRRSDPIPQDSSAHGRQTRYWTDLRAADAFWSSAMGDEDAEDDIANEVPRDAICIDAILRSMGVVEYEPKIVNQLLEFMHRRVLRGGRARRRC